MLDHLKFWLAKELASLLVVVGMLASVVLIGGALAVRDSYQRRKRTKSR